MVDQPGGWTDPTAIATGSAALGGIGATIVRYLFDWLRDQGKQRLDTAQQKSTAEEIVRDDLLSQLTEQRTEINALRRELAEARTEMREMNRQHQVDLLAWQQRYAQLLLEVTDLKTRMVTQLTP